MNTVSLIGRPNTGKSSLFNRMIGEDRSIIMDMPGITRDRIYGTVNYKEKSFDLVDTGGLELGKDNFKEDILGFYDIQFLIEAERTKEEEGFQIMGSHNVNGTGGIVWNNNTSIEDEE